MSHKDLQYERIRPGNEPLPNSNNLLPIMLAGFLIIYFVFFICPVFLNSKHNMEFFKYVSAINPIGVDLKQMLSYSESWFMLKQTPYIGANLYPPLATVLFTPLLFVDFATAYTMIVVVNLGVYIFTTYFFPLWLIARTKRYLSPWLMFFFITGLFSYGLQFELERGQFNLIAMFFCLFSIWIYHHHEKYRWWAYFLFAISIQLKVFPAIFIVMFVHDWKDWTNNIKRLIGLITLNFGLLFILGPQVFVDFLKAIKTQAVNPYVWIGNHSIRSFVGLFQMYGDRLPDKLSLMTTYSGLIQFVLLVFVAVCILLIILQAYRRPQKDINGYLLLACTVGSLIIPPVSHDYKLSILTAPVAVLFSTIHDNTYHRLPIIVSILVLAFSLAYSSVLFSYTNKPIILSNNLPALMTMLFIITGLSLITKSEYLMNS